MHVDRNVVCEKSFADSEGFIDDLLSRLELGVLELGTDDVFFDDGSESLIVRILE